MSSRAERRAPVIALFCGACCIGLAPVFPKLAFDVERALPRASLHGEPLGMIAAAFWRMALAWPVLALLGARRASERALSLRDRALLLLPGLAFAADMATWHKSFEYTALATTTLLSNFATVIVSLAGIVLWRERLGLGFALGLACALCGAALLLGVDFAAGPDPLRGDALAFATAFFYATYLVLVKQLRARFSTVRVLSWTTAVCALGLLAIAHAMGEGLVPHSARTWVALIALAWLSQIGGQGLITYAMAHLPASFATVSLLVQPVVAAIVSFLVFGQALGPLQLFGGSLVLCGIVIAQRASLPANEPTHES